MCRDRLLDEERAGPVYLRIPAVAQVVIASIGKGAPADYGLHAWVVMPNHVHMLITPHMEPSVGLRRLKGITSSVAERSASA